MIKNTPWGTPQHIAKLSDHILHITTSSHGGYAVPKPLAKDKMPADILKQIFSDSVLSGHGDHLYFEEDCMWVFVALYFPTAFGPDYCNAPYSEIKSEALKTVQWTFPNIDLALLPQ